MIREKEFYIEFYVCLSRFFLKKVLFYCLLLSCSV